MSSGRAVSQPTFSFLFPFFLLLLSFSFSAVLRGHPSALLLLEKNSSTVCTHRPARLELVCLSSVMGMRSTSYKAFIRDFHPL